MIPIIGVTGRLSAGKDTVSSVLEQRGAFVIDVDTLGHQALEAEKAALQEAFGSGIFDEFGTVNRKTLGNLVFSDVASLRKLEAISHPWMKREIERMIIQVGKSEEHTMVVIHAALLKRMKLDELCDYIIFVKLNSCKRFKRYKKRDNAGLWSFLSRDLKQKDVSPKGMEKGKKVFIVDNSKDEAYIYRQVDTICDNIRNEMFSRAGVVPT